MEQRDIEACKKLSFLPEYWERKLFAEGVRVGSREWSCMTPTSDINFVVISKKGEKEFNFMSMEGVCHTPRPYSHAWQLSAIFYARCKNKKQPVGIILVHDEVTLNAWKKASHYIANLMQYDEVYDILSEKKALRTEIFIRFLYMFGLNKHVPEKTLDFFLNMRQQEQSNMVRTR